MSRSTPPIRSGTTAPDSFCSMLAAGNPNGLRSLLSPGVEFEGITVPAGQLRGPNASDDPGELAFLIIESEQLLHHVTETLLRLLLAHAQRQSCPWLAVSSLKSFGNQKADGRIGGRPVAIRDPPPIGLCLPRPPVEWHCPRSGRSGRRGHRADHPHPRRDVPRTSLRVQRGQARTGRPSGRRPVTFAPSGSSEPAFSAGGPAITILEHRDAGPTESGTNAQPGSTCASTSGSPTSP